MLTFRLVGVSVQQVGGDTAEIMGEILEARADRVAINITLNSFGTPLNEVRRSFAHAARLRLV